MFNKANIAGFAIPTAVGSYLLYKKYYQHQIQSTEKKNIVLVGYGYAGRTFYNSIDKSKYNVNVILGENPTVLQPHFLDSLESNSRTKVVHKINLDLKIYDTILSIDQTAKTVTTALENKSDNIYQYDYLVMAIGHETSTFGIQGVDQNCLFYTSYSDLEKIRQISNSHRLKIAVIGASLAGLEVAGYLSDNHQIDVIEYASSILPTMKIGTQQAVHDLMQNKHKINFMLGTRLISVGKNQVTDKKVVHTEIKGSIKEEHEYDIVIWTAGVKPNENMNRWLNTNKVNEFLQIIGNQSIYAIGDCNNTMPKSGQSAKSQGKYLADLFNSNFQSNKGFIYKSMGIIIKLPNCVYIENEYYSGFAPRFIHDIVHYVNI